MWTTEGSHTLVRVAGTEHPHTCSALLRTPTWRAPWAERAFWEPALYHLPHSPKIQQSGHCLTLWRMAHARHHVKAVGPWTAPNGA